MKRQSTLAIIIALFVVPYLFVFQNCSASKSATTTQTEDVGFDQHYRSEAGDGVQTSSARTVSTSSTAALVNWNQGDIELATYGGYSPATVGAEKIWFGGWVSSADPMDYLSAMEQGVDPRSVFGPDKIFLAHKKNNYVETTGTTRLSFALAGYHVNDPTIIAPKSTDGINRSGWLYMYFTMLDNRLAETCRREKTNLLECPELFSGHDVGLASSVDGGVTWEFRGKVVAANTSGDGKGAWMPTVIAVGNELHLYYSSGAQTFTTPNLFRLRLNMNGISRLRTPERVTIEGFKTNELYANVDVKTAVLAGRTKYLMVANSGDQKKIIGLTSANGLHFKPLASPLMSAGSADTLLTPSIHTWGENTISGHSSSTTVGAFVQLHYVRKGTTSAYEIRRHNSIFFQVP